MRALDGFFFKFKSLTGFASSSASDPLGDHIGDASGDHIGDPRGDHAMSPPSRGAHSKRIPPFTAAKATCQFVEPSLAPSPSCTTRLFFTATDFDFLTDTDFFFEIVTSSLAFPAEQSASHLLDLVRDFPEAIWVFFFRSATPMRVIAGARVFVLGAASLL